MVRLIFFKEVVINSVYFNYIFMLIIIIIPFIMETLQGKNQNITELDPTILIIVIFVVFVEWGACWARPTL